MNIPGIGIRIIKSATAVSLCMVVNLLRGSEGMVFYSMLAALWCVQMYRNNTLANATQRTTGTIVGAAYGLIYILLYSHISGIQSNWPQFGLILRIICVFISIIMVIYTTVLLHKNQASYFSCVVFLSIIVNHIGDSNPYIFVWNRFLDTMIGIVIGVCVNNAVICFNRDRDTLFVSGVDGLLVDKDNRISAFSKVELNRMIDDGLRFTIATLRTPASLLEVLSDIHFRYPVIVMDGAALYDVQKSEYVREYVISEATSCELLELMNNYDMNPLINVIIDDTLLIYHQDSTDEINKELIAKLRRSPYRNFINRKFPGDEKVVYFMLLDTDTKIERFYEKLCESGYDKKLKIIKYQSEEYKGYSYIKIYNKNASKDNMLQYLQKSYDMEHVLTFGTIPGKYDFILEESNLNKLVRLIKKRYEPFPGVKYKYLFQRK